MQRIAYSIIAWLLTMMLSINATAAPTNNWATAYDQCIDQTIKANHLPGINTAGVEICANRVSDAAKKEINRLYQVFYQRVSAESADDAAAFESAQKSWLNYRNTHCELMGRYVGSPMYAYCPMTLNVARVQELQELVGE